MSTKTLLQSNSDFVPLAMSEVVEQTDFPKNSPKDSLADSLRVIANDVVASEVSETPEAKKMSDTESPRMRVVKGESVAHAASSAKSSNDDPLEVLQQAFAGEKKKKTPSPAFFTIPQELAVAPHSNEFRVTSTIPACGVVAEKSLEEKSKLAAKRVGLLPRREQVATAKPAKRMLAAPPSFSFPQVRHSEGGLDLSESSDADLTRVVDAWTHLPRSVRSAILAIVYSVDLR